MCPVFEPRASRGENRKKNGHTTSTIKSLQYTHVVSVTRRHMRGKKNRSQLPLQGPQISNYVFFEGFRIFSASTV